MLEHESVQCPEGTYLQCLEFNVLDFFMEEEVVY